MTSLEPSAAQTIRENDERRVATDRERRERKNQNEDLAAKPRWSPDPFVATDRYRLTMPYADRI